MPDLDDFHAFMSTTGKNSGGNSNGSSGGGSSSGCLPWILAIITLFWIVGKLSG